MKIYEVMMANASIETAENKMKDNSQNSIAVLPFVNMSSDPEQEYFSDGMAEEILNSLSHLKDLKVAGRTSSFQFKGKNIDLREVGEKLGVKTVLEGSVRKQGNHIRITAQLIAVEDGFHLWSEKYDRNMDDIFAIQDEIALSITEQLKITLLEKDRKFITKITTQNAEAYELYLKGKFYLSRRGSSIITALNFFKQSMEVDPGFALAHAGYSEASIYSAFYSYISGKEVMNQVKLAAETARKLDSSLCEPYISLGHYYLNFEWNWVEAKKNYNKAIEINPKHAQAHNLYGMVYLAWVEGKFDEAEIEGQTALKLEPLSAVDHADLAWTLWTAFRFEEALSFANKGIELDANSFLSHRLAGFCYLRLKRYEEAIDTFNHLLNISNRHQHALNPLIWCYCSNGNMQEARILMNELEKRSVTEYIAGTHFGISAAYLGELDTAFSYLEKACRDYDPVLIQLKYSPFVPESLRSDPRFQNILDLIGFPE